MRRAAALLGALLAVAARGEEVPAPGGTGQAASKVLEVDASAAYSFLLSSRNSNGTTLSRRNGGPGGALSALLRTSYFLSPFLDVSFQPLYASTDRFDLSPQLGGPVTVRSSLLALDVVAGAAYDLGRLRLRGGLGWSDVMVHSRSGSLRTSEWDLMYFLSAAGAIWASGPLSVGIEGRAGVIGDAGISFVSFGIVGRGDVLSWPRPH